ncbi:MAG: hypothetical protein ABIU05_11705 [Nitrospirales bacterium]
MELDRLTRDNNQGEIERIRATAPRAIPSSLMRTLWRLILAGRLKSRTHRHDLYEWLGRFKQDGLTLTLRMELREVLTPRVALREPFRMEGEPETTQEATRINDLVEWEMVLSAGHVHAALRDMEKLPSWLVALPDLLQDFSLLLRDALDLMHELGDAQDKSDQSYVQHPSISAHSQNRDFRDWTALIDLTRDAWVATAHNDPAQAHRTAEWWWKIPYPLFKRLAFFAATQGNVIATRQALDWLLADAHWWLLSAETEHEVIRLLLALAPRLDDASLAELEQAILQGPPRKMFRDDMEPEYWERRVKSEVWLRLKKIHAAGVALGQAATAKLDDITQMYPEWKLATDESDEFPFWMGEAEGTERKLVAIPTPPTKSLYGSNNIPILIAGRRTVGANAVVTTFQPPRKLLSPYLSRANGLLIAGEKRCKHGQRIRCSCSRGSPWLASLSRRRIPSF